MRTNTTIISASELHHKNNNVPICTPNRITWYDLATPNPKQNISKAQLEFDVKYMSKRHNLTTS